MKPEDIIKECKARFEIARDMDNEWRDKAIEDLSFLDPDKQWDEGVKRDREVDGRPVLSVDRIGPIVRQIVNDFRQNYPSLKVSPVDNKSDVETADIISGLIRNIESSSNAKMSYTSAYENAVRVGRGYLRLLSDYVDEGSFDQELKIEAIENPFTVYYDQSYTQPDGSDAEWCIISTDITEESFEREWPGKDASSDGDFSSVGNENLDNNEQKMVRILEYFFKTRKKVKIHLLEDGTTAEGKLPEGMEAVKTRDSFKTEVHIIKTQGIDILEETIWPCAYLPIIPVFGDVLNINGKRDYRGVIRAAKDPQRIINLHKSSMAEMISAAPKSPWIGPKGFVGNRGAEWAASNTRNVPYLEYEHTDTTTGQPLPPPQRNFGEPAIQAMAAITQMSEGDIKATTSAYDPVMGQSEAKQSGRAILALQNQGQVSNLHFIDNLSRAMKLLGHQIISVLPTYYDTERIIRIIGEDDEESLVKVNSQEPDDKFKRVFDLKVGKYDVACDMGPGYATKRMETQAVILETLKFMPVLSQVAPDKLASILIDDPISGDIVERLKKTIPQELLSQKDLEQAKESQNEQEQQPIPPQIQAQLKQLMDMNKALTEELNTLSDVVEKKKLDIESRERIACLQEENKLTIALLNKGIVEPATKMAEEIDNRQAIVGMDEEVLAGLNQMPEQPEYTEEVM